MPSSAGRKPSIGRVSTWCDTPGGWRFSKNNAAENQVVSEKTGNVMREKVKLVSTADTGYFYTTTKNTRKDPDKLELEKYDPVVQEHVTFVEKKLD